MAERKAMRGQGIVKKRIFFFPAQMEFVFIVFDTASESEGGGGGGVWLGAEGKGIRLLFCTDDRRKETTVPCNGVDLFSDGEPLVLGANVDGYIPMKFSSGSVLQVTGIPITYSPQILHKSRNKDVAKPWKMQQCLSLCFPHHAVVFKQYLKRLAVEL